MEFSKIFARHDGKISDKWQSYLGFYDEVFRPYKEDPVRILEVGIQNGGSLEVYSKYFANFSKIVGVDIEPRCGELKYDNENIHVVVGDCSALQTYRSVRGFSPEFDIIIDDGSHKSSDIIETFLRYFRLLREGGIYVIEDLHASYWQDWQGGLFEPQSSMRFLKLLTDVVNFEHWGIPATRADLVSRFFPQYQLIAREEDLAKVGSVLLQNSLCLIKKTAPAAVSLGRRQIRGTVGLISDPRDIDGSLPMQIDQSNNPRSRF